MPEAPAADVIVFHLDHQFGQQWMPLGFLARIPPTWTTRRFAGDPMRSDELLQLLRQGGTTLGRDAGGKADVMKKTIFVVESEL